MRDDAKATRIAESARSFVSPTESDRQRVREALDQAIARGTASDTVRRVESAMVKNAPLLSEGGMFSGGKLYSIVKLILPALIVGFGAGALWGRNHPALDATAASAKRVQPLAAATTPRTTESATSTVAAAGSDEAPTPETGAVTADSEEARTATDSDRLASASGPELAAVRAGKWRAPQAATVSKLKGRSAADSGNRVDDTPPPPTAANGNDATPQEHAADLPPPGDSHATGSHLAAELRLMRAATEALKASDYARVERVISKHAGTYPDGALAQERQALHLIVSCKTGRPSQVRAEREAFLAHAAESPLTARVHAACEPTQ